VTGTAPLRWIIDRRSELGAVRWQGDRGTCLSFAATSSHDHQRAAIMSVEYLHWATTTQPLGAGKIPSLVTALTRQGQPPEPQWPYDPDRDETVGYRPPLTATGPFHTADVALVGHDTTAVVDELQRGSLPVIGLRVSGAFYGSTGVVDSDDPGTDGHAVLAVGAATIDAGGQVAGLQPGDPLILIRNSWGDGWGAQGHALLTPRTWSAVVLAALTVTPHSSPGNMP